jgi:hypothetical protein
MPSSVFNASNPVPTNDIMSDWAESGTTNTSNTTSQMRKRFISRLLVTFLSIIAQFALYRGWM